MTARRGPPGPGDAARALTPDPWAALASVTPSRLALGRCGASLPTREVLKLGLAHARARDAVHAAADFDRLRAGLVALGHAALDVESAAPDRAVYLRRPDLGRRLSARSRASLVGTGTGYDIAIVVADGLSSAAVDANALPLVEALLQCLPGRRLGPFTLVRQGRVALGDEIGALLEARLALVLIGERPGLSAADSLGAYLTFAPRVGLTDAARNCVSNIRPGGLPPEAAARTLAWLIERALALSLSGVALKDESGADTLAPAGRTAIR